MEIATKEDLEVWKQELLNGIKILLENRQTKQEEKWLKSKEVRKILNCSAGTLNSLKDKLKWAKVNGVIYWSYNSIQEMLEKNSSN